MKQDLHPTGKLNSLGKSIATLVAVDHRDVRGWAEVVSLFLLLGIVVVNVVIAFYAWFMAAGTFFQIGWQGQVGAGLVGAMLIGFIDWMIVASHPSLPGWFVVGAPAPRHTDRIWWVLAVALLSAGSSFVALRWLAPVDLDVPLPVVSLLVFGLVSMLTFAGAALVDSLAGRGQPQGIETSSALPVMPGGLNRAAPLILRLLLAAFIGLVAVGPALNIAMNREAVEDQRVISAIAAKQEEFDQEADRLRDEARASFETQNDAWVQWQEQLVPLQGLVGEAETARDKAWSTLMDANTWVKCEFGEQTGAACDGISPSAGRGQELSVAARDNAYSEWVLADGAVNTAEGEVTEHADARPAQPEAPDVIVTRTATKADVEDGGLTTGLQVTFRAWDDLTADWGWPVKHGPGIALFVFDIMPVLFKFLMGYLRPEQRSWTRNGHEVLVERWMLEEKSRDHQAKKELAEAQQQSGLEQAQAASASAVAVAKVEGDAAIAAAKTRMEVLAEALAKVDVNWAAHAVEMSARDIAQAANQGAHDRQHDILERRAATPSPLHSASQLAQPVLAEDTPVSERETPADDVVTGRSSGAPAWAQNPVVQKIPPGQLIEVGSSLYKLGPSLVPPQYARSDVRLAIKIPLPGPQPEVNESSMASRCVVVKSPPRGTMPEQWRKVLERHEALPSHNHMPEVVNGVIVDRRYHPRTDLERHMGQLAREQIALPYAQVARWGVQILDGLKILHESGHTHNDMKARNVVVRGVMALGVPKLAGSDLLGDVQLIDFDSADAELELVHGSPPWMAPEHIDSREYPELAGRGTFANDIFGVGAILLFVLNNVKINLWVDSFEGGPRLSPEGLVHGWHPHYAHVYAHEFDRLRGDTPEPLWNVIRCALDPNPRQRLTLMRMRDSLAAVHKEQGSFTPAEERAATYPPTGHGPEVVKEFQELNYRIN